ncbi:hypothetical protein SH139x_000678 [Planctomycetaceae bacterium SH139]
MNFADEFHHSPGRSRPANSLRAAIVFGSAGLLVVLWCWLLLGGLPQTYPRSPVPQRWSGGEQVALELIPKRKQQLAELKAQLDRQLWHHAAELVTAQRQPSATPPADSPNDLLLQAAQRWLAVQPSPPGGDYEP